MNPNKKIFLIILGSVLAAFLGYAINGFSAMTRLFVGYWFVAVLFMIFLHQRKEKEE